MVEKVVMFRTTDKKIFEVEAKAREHQKKLDLAKEILEVLGGTNFSIHFKSHQDFIDGEGYVVISQEKYKIAEKLISKLLEEVDMSGGITSHRAYGNQYTEDVARVWDPIVLDDGILKRVCSSYFKNKISGFEIK